MLMSSTESLSMGWGCPLGDSAPFDPDSWSVAHGQLSIHVCWVNKWGADIYQCHGFYLFLFLLFGSQFLNFRSGRMRSRIHMRLLPSRQRFILDSLPLLSSFFLLCCLPSDFLFLCFCPLPPLPSASASWWEMSSWLADSCLLFVSSHGGKGALVCLPLLIRSPVESRGLYPHDLM